MANRIIRTSIHGSKLGLTDAGHIAGEGFAGSLVGDLPGTIYAEGTGPFLKQTQFDDFLGKTISGQWNLNKGTDGATVNFANTAALGGSAVATMGANASVDMAGNGVQIDDGMKTWQANKGGLMMEARVKTDALTSRAIFIGFTDTITLLMPFTISGSTLTANDADAVGFLFDTAATAATIKAVGVANSVKAAIQDIGVAGLATAAYHLFRVEVDVNGNASFFIDGVQVGTAPAAGTNYNMAVALRPSIPVSPCVAGFTRAAGTGTITLDWIRAQQTRPA